MRQRAVVIVLAIAVVALAGAVVYTQLQLRALRPAAAGYVQQCHRVEVAMHVATQLLNDPSARETAAQQFLESQESQSYEDVAACVDDGFAIPNRNACAQATDRFACLREQASAIEAAVHHHLE